MNSEELEKFLRIFNVEFPTFVLNKIVLLFADGDSNNWDIFNIDYCFKDGPLECPFYSGFFYVPGFSRYVINKNGDLLVVKTGISKKWSKSYSGGPKNIRGGYFVSHGICDIERKRKGLSRHRLLCLTFKHPGHHTGNLVTNHLDGVPGNDSIDNIEFCTYSANTQHAYDSKLYPNKTTAVDLLNWKTDKVHRVDSIVACSVLIDISVATLYSRISNSNAIRYPDGWRIKRVNDTWSVLNDRERELESNIDVICRDVFTNKTFIFGSISDASKETGISVSTIRRQTEEEPVGPVYGWNFRRLNTFESWPVYTEQHLEIFKDNPCRAPDGIEVYDCVKNEMLFFTSPSKAGEYFNISPITASKLARYEGTRQMRFKFKLFRIKQT